MTPNSLGQVNELLDGRFELEAPLADAGLAEAWRARDASAGRKAKLVKLFRPSPKATEPWKDVVARLRRLGNPRIPKVLDGGQTADGRRWLAYEPTKGRSLANWLEGHRQAGTAPSPAMALRVFGDAAAALQVGHGMPAPGVVHGGFSPRSVMLERLARDYGIALLDHALAPLLGTDDTRAFKAPELLERSERVTVAGDVFALAVVWLNLVTLRTVPREGSPETWAEFVVRAPKEVRAHLASLRTDIPADLWRIVEDALSTDPARRPQDAGQFATKLRKACPEAWRVPSQIEPEPPMPAQVVARVVPRDPRAASGGVVDRWVEAERAPRAPEPRHPSTPSVAGSSFVSTPYAEVAPAPLREISGDAAAATLVDAFLDEPPADDSPAATLIDSGPPSERWPTGEGGARALPAHIEQLVSRRKSTPALDPAHVAPAEQTTRRVGGETLGLEEHGSSHGWQQQAPQAGPDVTAVLRRAPPASLPPAPASSAPEESRAVALGTVPHHRVGGDTLDLSEGNHDFAGSAATPLPITPVVAPPSPTSQPSPSPRFSPSSPIVRLPTPPTAPHRPPDAPSPWTPALMASMLLGVLALLAAVAFAVLRAK